jgi:AraC family transcriptional regulator
MRRAERGATSRAAARSTAAAVDGIRARIAANIDQIPRLADLAVSAKMSRYQLSRMFRKHVGLCLREYVMSLRLDRACDLLATSSQSITTTAMDCGFYDLSHFDRMFRRRFGMTPRAFRRWYARQRSAGATTGESAALRPPPAASPRARRDPPPPAPGARSREPD